MTVLTNDRRFLPLSITVALAIALSVVAYAGRIPPAVAAHGIDKVLHTAMSFTLTLCLGRALRGRIVLAAFTIFAVLAIDEYLQRFSSSRSSDWGDLLADVTGGALAVALWRRLRRTPPFAA